jgi:hypothetical protein
MYLLRPLTVDPKTAEPQLVRLIAKIAADACEIQCASSDFSLLFLSLTILPLTESASTSLPNPLSPSKASDASSSAASPYSTPSKWTATPFLPPFSLAPSAPNQTPSSSTLNNTEAGTRIRRCLASWRMRYWTSWRSRRRQVRRSRRRTFNPL